MQNDRMTSGFLDRLEALLSEENDFISCAANFCALVYEEIPGLNWVGLYMKTGDELILGPFQGRVACVRIKIGKGVCGSAAETRKTLIVGDVDKFPGHIRCDAASKSEIVIPIVAGGKLYGVLDIDSPEIDRFSPEDVDLLESALDIFIEQADFTKIDNYYDL